MESRFVANLHQRKRIERMQEQRIFLVAIDEKKNFERPGDLLINFSVAGSTANLYKVILNLSFTAGGLTSLPIPGRTLKELINCDCPDSVTGLAHVYGIKCKHCCFVLLKVLKNDFSILERTILKEENLEVLRNKYRNLEVNSNLLNSSYRKKYLKILTKLEKNKENEKNATMDDKHKRANIKELDPNMECIICYDVLFTNNEALVTHCSTCKNVIHTDCIQKWLALGNKNCIFCRSPWEKEDLPNTNQKEPKKYINLGYHKNWSYFGSDSENSESEDTED